MDKRSPASPRMTGMEGSTKRPGDSFFASSLRNGATAETGTEPSRPHTTRVRVLDELGGTDEQAPQTKCVSAMCGQLPRKPFREGANQSSVIRVCARTKNEGAPFPLAPVQKDEGVSKSSHVYARGESRRRLLHRLVGAWGAWGGHKSRSVPC